MRESNKTTLDFMDYVVSVFIAVIMVVLPIVLLFFTEVDSSVVEKDNDCIYISEIEERER